MSRFFIFLAFVAVNLSGCSKVDPKLYGTDGPVADGDTMIESSIGDAKSLNPVLVDEVTGADIAGLVFNGLLRYNAKLELEASLAEKWHVSPDGKVITYDLRKGVKFHDGVEFTSADVIFTYQVQSSPKVAAPAGSYYQDISKVEVLGPYKVRVSYKQPFAPALAGTFAEIVPKHLLEGKDINHYDAFNRSPVGTGPYKFVEWKTAQKIVLEANPDYWEGKPHLQRFVLQIIPDQTTEFLEILNGGIDALGAWTHGVITPEQYVRQTDVPKFKDYYHKRLADDFRYSYLGWNLQKPMFKDKTVRQALTMAIDRDAIIKNVVYGLGQVCSGPYATQSWAYNKAVKPLPFDQEKAKRLLASAGWKDTDSDGLLDSDLDGDGKREPFKFTLLTNQGNVSRERIATIVQQQLKLVGIQVDIQILEWTTFLSQYVDKKRFDAMILGWAFGPEPDNYTTFHSSQTGEHQNNHVGYANAEVDLLLEKGRRTLDQVQRKRIYHRVHELIAEDQPYTFLYVPNNLSVVHKRFKGYKNYATNILVHPESWYVPKDQQKHFQ